MKKKNASVARLRRKLNGFEKQLDRFFEALDRSRMEFDLRMKKLDERIDNVAKEVGKVSDALGRFSEGIAAPALPKVLAAFGLNITGTAARRGSVIGGKAMEMDLIAIDAADAVAACSIKPMLRISDVDAFLEDIAEFRKFFPEYAGRRIYAVVGGMSFQQGVDKYAESHGLIVIAPSDETIKVLNSPSFAPRVF